jgi:imidazolonepropionase-like amidohydrolase
MQPLARLSVILFFATTSFAQQAYRPAAGRTLLRAGRVLDVHTGKEAAAETIVIEGDRITAIAPTSSTPAASGDREVDLTAYTLLPGLIDVHTHLTMAPNFDPYFELSMTDGKEAIIGVENAKTTLEAGFTTVRNVGAGGFTDVALRDEINAGHIPGPHMQVSGPALGITGGHMDENLLPSQYHVVGEGVADGIAAVQHMVRQNIKYGADLIKIGASGGVLSKGDDPQASQYTLEEMQAIVADAHRLGRKVAAHAHGAQAILWASEAGVDSIEHGSYLDDAGIAMMKKHGTYLVPTAYLIDWMQANGHLPDIYLKKMHDVSAVEKQNAIKAIKAGVKVALGTDAAVYPHGLNAHELDVYVNQFGMTPLAAIQTGTVNAADLMGWTDRTGSLEPGKWADIIAVKGDPLADVRILESVPFVMKGGIIYKNEANPAAIDKLQASSFTPAPPPSIDAF